MASLRRRAVLRLRPLAAALLSLALASGAAAADYPDHPIRVIVPSSPGTVIDSIARIVGPAVGARLGQPLVVDNVDGAGGILGTSQLVRAPKDGYTVGFTAAGLVISPHFYRVSYDVGRDLTPISLLAGGTAVLAVPADSPYGSLDDLLKAAKAKADGSKLSFGSPGLGTPLFLASAMLFQQAGVKLLHVPYKSFNQYVVDLLAGRFDVGYLPEDTALAQIRAGKLRPLAVSTGTRDASLPDVPTVAEAGVPGYVFESWFAVIAPAGLPAGVAERLNAAVTGALKDQAVAAALGRLGLTTMPTNLARTAQIVGADYDRYGAVARGLAAK